MRFYFNFNNYNFEKTKETIIAIPKKGIISGVNPAFIFENGAVDTAYDIDDLYYVTGGNDTESIRETDAERFLRENYSHIIK